MKRTRISAKGQVTIPKRIRDATGLVPNTEVDISLDGAGVRIGRTRASDNLTRGELVVSVLRRARPHIRMSTDELMRLTRGED